MTSDLAPLRHVHLFTDGACSGNPGKGGWGYVLRDLQSQKEKEGSGAERETTNNRMELKAVIEGLKALSRPCRVSLYSDSNYVLNGLKEWMPNWKKNNWRRKSGSRWEEVKNAELWKELDSLQSIHKISFHHIKGHSGHPENERCDQLAVSAYLNL
ncbi:MAG: ribonuclease HI [Pirellula sp.]|jgi:ribonuclease HI